MGRKFCHPADHFTSGNKSFEDLLFNLNLKRHVLSTGFEQVHENVFFNVEKLKGRFFYSLNLLPAQLTSVGGESEADIVCNKCARSFPHNLRRT